MGSYEEQVVDQSVDAAWLGFRVRLADRLADMNYDDEIVLAVTPAGKHAPLQIRLCAVDDESVEARFIGLMSTSRHLRIRRSTWARLRSLGVDPADGCRLTVERTRVDHVAYTVYAFLHEELAIVHPAFVDVAIGDLVLVEPPKDLVAPRAPAPLPDAVAPESHDELVKWVDRTLAVRLGHPPDKGDTGAIGVINDHGQLTVRVSSTRPVIEVFAVIAKDVDRKRGRKEVNRLNGRFHFFRFFVRGDSLIMASTVSATPFAPEHLGDTMDMTFYFLQHRAPKIAARVARREATPDPSVGAEPVADDLLLVYGAAADHDTMVQMARRLANDSRTRLGNWRHAAASAGKLARDRAAKVEHGPVQNALIEQHLVWRKVADAMHAAAAEIGNERQAA